MNEPTKYQQASANVGVGPSVAEVAAETIAAAKATIEELPERISVLLSALFDGDAFCGHKFTSTKPPGWAVRLGRRMREAMLPGFDVWRTNDGDPEADGYFCGRIAQILSSTTATTDMPETVNCAREFARIFLPAVQSQVAVAAALPWESHKRFFVSYAKGLSESIVSPRKRGQQLTSPRFMFYLILLFMWPEVEAKQNSRQLFEFFKSNLPDYAVGDLDTFQRLCRDIGLYKGRAGRPPKNRSVKKRTAS